MKHAHPSPSLRLIQGGLAREKRLGQTRLQILPLTHSLPVIHAIVEEQDTHRLLDTSPAIIDPPQDLPQLVAAMVATPAVIPGTVQVIKGSPMRLRAIVYDIEQEPICNEAWLIGAYDHLLQAIAHHRLASVALPLLGMAHGRIPAALSLARLLDALARHPAETPLSLWLRVPEATLGEVAQQLHR